MFSLFKKPEVSIRSITIPHLGWEMIRNEPNIIQWADPQNPNVLSLNFFHKPPDLPSIKHIAELRKFYRTMVSGANGGILQVDLFRLGKIPIVKTLFKFPQQPSGIAYVASLTLPFRDCSFVIKLSAGEKGHTGAREALVMNQWLGRDNNVLSDWPRDPYDSTFNVGRLMNLSEQEIYDAQFPNHHLTKVRIFIAQLEKEIKSGPEIGRLAAFDPS